MQSLVGRARRIYRHLPVRVGRRSLFRLYDRYLRLSGQERVQKTVDGITYELDLRELIDSTIFFEGAWEPGLATALRRLCKPGDQVIDVGANMGCHALLMARLVGPSGRVIAFEPMSNAFRRLQRNVSLNTFPNIVLVNEALSDRNATERAAFPSSWFLDLSPNVPEPEAVEFVRLDSYLENSRDLLRCDLIKIDVDGNEYEVLRGGMLVLRRFHPIIVMELGRGSQRALELLKDFGYTFRSLQTLVELPSVSAMLSLVPKGDGKTINMVAIAELDSHLNRSCERG